MTYLLHEVIKSIIFYESDEILSLLNSLNILPSGEIIFKSLEWRGVDVLWILKSNGNTIFVLHEVKTGRRNYGRIRRQLRKFVKLCRRPQDVVVLWIWQDIVPQIRQILTALNLEHVRIVPLETILPIVFCRIEELYLMLNTLKLRNKM